MKARVRYAPSPTGLQHIGSVRTALFNYLFARSVGGTFILRLEDTDRTRSSDAYVKNLYDTFRWLGFYWDEGPDVGGPAGPYTQSERFALYREHADRLVEMGKAYYCFCSDEKSAKKDDAVDEDDAAAAEQGATGFGYPRTCRSIDPAEAKRRADSGEPHVIRLKIPLDGVTGFDDILLGHIEWKNADVNPDPVLLKSDGFPTYHLANVVDDHLMGITHVMRAQEWIPSAPLHIIMYEAFGWDPPQLCHLPMVLGEDGHKLSKRHGATAVDEFRKKGYLEAALINYVAMLGCSYEDGRDIFSLEDLARLFSMDHINKAPAVFDYVKLEWFNGQYIRMLSDEELVGRITPFMVASGLVSEPPSAAQTSGLLAAAPLVKERLKYLSDAPEALRFLFAEPAVPPAAEMLPKKLDVAGTAKALDAAVELLGTVDPSDHDACEAAFRAKATELGFKLGDLLMPLRVAVTGTKVSPPLFQSIAVLGRDKAVERARKALAVLRAAI
ncbi:MAG: glutamate--tRNA ligase [Spirochaetae bacterium HGW-Spirochaetae-3]|jgi:glutamyl-tRNA synthetase|nr:MAG: glutamate--tRNA ligase [Spirochaetae bacterium HGW-Spirochaetae-3]